MQRLKTLAFASSTILLFASVLAGCGISAPIDEPVGSPVNPGPSVKTGPIKGTVLGGGVPIVGAKIFLFAASQAGYGITTSGTVGSASSSLLVANGTQTAKDNTATDITYGDYYVTTDSTGSFSLSGDYPACTTGTHLYLFSLGGQTTSGSTVNNSAAGEMAVLPDCPATGLSFIYMNEVSTIAAAYAFAGFAYDAVHVGALGGVGTLADTGIKHAFLNASNIYDISNQLAGNTGGSAALDSSGNVIRNQALVDTLANILQYCINSVDSGSSISAHCSSLFGSSGAENSGKTIGKTGTTATAETATAAIFIAHNPSRNVSSMDPGMVNTTPSPFSPALTAAPNDFSIQLEFTGGGLGLQKYIAPHDVAVDASGNIWVTSYTTNTLSEFNTLGVPSGSSGFVAGATGFTGNGMSGPTSVAIDTSGNVLLSNGDAMTTDYTLSKFTLTGAVVGKYNPGSLQFPTDAEFDSSGNIWLSAVNNAGTTYVTDKLPAVPTTITTTYQFSSSTPFPYTLSPSGSSGNTCIADFGSTSVDFLANTDTGLTDLGASYAPYGTAIDSSNQCWITESSNYVAVATSSGGTQYNINAKRAAKVYYAAQPDGVALDGASNAWVTDPPNGTVYNISNAGVIPNTYGYPAIGNTTSVTSSSMVSNEPDGIAVDGSGNVWYRTLNDSSLREIVGIAIPVVTPLAYGVAHNTQGTRP